MAKTLIGQLILRLRTEGLGEAQKVTKAIQNVEAAARRLGTAGVASWGIGFQKQLDRLKLSANDMRQVERSWVALHDSMKSRNLASALKSSEISHWKTNMVSTLAQGRAAVDDHFRRTEASARAHGKRLQNVLKPALVMMGAYTAPYFAGILGMEALGASSERRREIFRQQMANISPGDQEKMFQQSESLGQKFPSVPITAIMEMSRNAYSLMGDADRAMAVVERMTEAFVTLQSVKGVDTAVTQLVGLLRGFDNLGVNKDGLQGIELVNQLIDAAVKAAQVDPDFDPGTFFPFAKRTKVAGPALSPDFLARASVYMQDMGPDTAGNALAMAFKAFVLEAVGSAGGAKYLKERNRIGIRQDGKLVDAEMFGSDPDKWVVKHLIPALRRDGVDLNNDTAVASAVGKLSGNTNATGLLTRIITQREQIERWLRLMDSAVGTDAAKDARHNDPFVGWEAFKKSLENLSAALIPIDAINRGLNGLADGINALAAAAQENPFMVGAGIGAAGYGMYQGGKFAFNKMTDLFGLRSSALALDGSAAALTRAAIALGGAGVVDGGGGKAKGKGWGMFGLGSAASWLLMATAGLPSDTVGNGYAGASPEERQRMRDEARAAAAALNGPAPSAGRLSPRGAEDASMRAYNRDRSGIDAMIEDARSAGAEIGEALSPKAKPDVDTSAIDVAIQKARTLLSLLTNASAAAARAEQQLDVEMRRNFSDAMP